MADAAETKCPRCLADDHTLIACPYVKAIDFNGDMNITRVEFLTPADYGTRTSTVGDDTVTEPDYPKLGQQQKKA